MTGPLPAAFEPVLRRLNVDSLVHFGCASARVEPVEYRERPFSHVLRAAVLNGEQSRVLTQVFVKIFKMKPEGPDADRMRHRVVNDFEATRQIHVAMSRWPDLGAVRPIACYPEYLASVTEEVPGETLLDHLRSHAAWAPQPRAVTALSTTMKKAGRWVRAFQSIGESAGLMSIESVRTYVDVRLKRLVATPAAGFAPADRGRVLDYIERLGGMVDPADLVETTVHADLAPANMLVSGERIVVLDFAMCGRGSIFHDLSRLFLQIDLLRLKPQFRGTVIDSLGRALLAGFDPQLTPDRPMFRVLLMQHRINHLATLSLSAERFPASLYNWHVRRHHRASIWSELRRAAREGSANSMNRTVSSGEGRGQ